MRDSIITRSAKPTNVSRPYRPHLHIAHEPRAKDHAPLALGSYNRKEIQVYRQPLSQAQPTAHRFSSRTESTPTGKG